MRLASLPPIPIPVPRAMTGLLAAGLTMLLGMVGIHAPGGAASPEGDIDVADPAEVAAGGDSSAEAGAPPALAFGTAVASEHLERDSIRDLEPEDPPPFTHRVEPGETASGIARRHGVPTSRLVRANALDRPDRLRPGQRLVVPDPTAEPAAGPQQAAAAHPEVATVLDEAAQRFGWNPATVKAVAWVESRWNQRLVSHRGAIGLMQVQPATGEVMAANVGQPIDLHDPADNALAGVAYLDFLYHRHGGDLAATLAAYHQGPDALLRHGPYPLSDWYVEQVLQARQIFRAG